MLKWYRMVDGGVTAPLDFLAGAVAAGIKKSQKKDLALIYSTRPATAAVKFTTNRVQAAPLLVSRANLRQGAPRAVIVNSGNANSCTGDSGIKDAREMAALAAKELDLLPEEVLVASTGVIGVPLPVEKLRAEVPRLVKKLHSKGGPEAAEAIMTTDTRSKLFAITFRLSSGEVTVGGIAKGSGMINPSLATMLAFLSTDAAIDQACLNEALTEAVQSSFNLVNVDGDTSTNDMVAVLANGAAGNRLIDNVNSHDFILFKKGLIVVCTELAKMIARDGEGATKFLEVKVVGAPRVRDARLAAKAVVSSNLVKSALYGEDANWGRILAAVGYSGAEFDPARVDIYLGALQVAAGGGGMSFDEEIAKAVLKEKDITVTVDLRLGNEKATAWGCDLSYEYVRINADYRT